MKLGTIPFDGLFLVYTRVNGDLQKITYGVAPGDIPESLREADVVRLYPYNDSIIVEV